MKRLLMFLMILTLNQTFGQKINEKSLLWEISGNNLKQSSYLFGSISYSCLGDSIMSEKILDTFDGSESLLVISDSTVPNFESMVFQTFIMNDDSTVDNYLDEITLSKLKSVIENRSPGYFEFLIKNYKLQFLLIQLDQFSFDCQFSPGNELILTDRALQNDKEIIDVETFETGAAYIFSISDKEAEESIEFLMSNYEKFKSIGLEFYEFYKNQNISEIYNLFRNNQQNSIYRPYDFNNITANRISKWIPNIDLQINQKSVFIMVDSLYLAGEDGLINQLRMMSYTVKPINIKF